jgi:hypothetical protein
LKVMSQITLHHGKFKGISLCTSKDQASGWFNMGNPEMHLNCQRRLRTKF